VTGDEHTVFLESTATEFNTGFGSPYYWDYVEFNVGQVNYDWFLNATDYKYCSRGNYFKLHGQFTPAISHVNCFYEGAVYSLDTRYISETEIEFKCADDAIDGEQAFMQCYLLLASASGGPVDYRLPNTDVSTV